MKALVAAPDAAALKARATELGLDVCGITSADPARQAAWTATAGSSGRVRAGTTSA